MNTSVNTALAEAITTVTGVTLSEDASFFEAGITSAHVVTIHELVQRSLGRQFPVTAFFRHPTRRAMADFLATAPVRQAVLTAQPDSWTAQARRDIRARIRDRQA